jgi:hypothetical protein
MNTTSTQTTVRDALAQGVALLMAQGRDFDTALRLSVQAMAETNPRTLAILAR